MMNMRLLAVVTLTSIYHGCSTLKMLWYERFTGEENFTLGEFTAVNMKTFGCRKVRKHSYIKGSDKYVTLDISLKFDSLDKIKLHLQSRNIIQEILERGRLLLWVSGPKQSKKNAKSKVCHRKCK